jgi:hypothetical protein
VTHIARNVQTSFGPNTSRYVFPMAKTFSQQLFADLLSKVSPAARQYLERIPASQWRSAAWLDDPSLPPRYGILTSNMSESANNMFDQSRDGSWLYTLDTILSTVTERITKLRLGISGKTGVIGKLVALLNWRWKNCASFQVVQLQHNGSIFTIIRKGKRASENDTRFNIDVINKICDCGEWQDHGVPCIDAIAYFRLHKRVLLEQVLSEQVDHFYTYDNERSLLSSNIVPVCMDRICHDRTTLPPGMSSKRSTGRPKKKRIRKRSRHAYDPQNSKIVCRRCRTPGHNTRTCLEREALAANGDDIMDNIQMNDLS